MNKRLWFHIVVVAICALYTYFVATFSSTFNPYLNHEYIESDSGDIY